MIIYRYRVKSRYLTSVEKDCLRGGDEVICASSPRQMKELYCADFQFPNGDVFPLRPCAVHLDSVEADEG